MTLREELAMLADHGRAQGMDQGAAWIERHLAPPRPRRAKRMAPPPKVPNLDRQPRPYDVFKNLRTGWETIVMDHAPEGGYVRVLNGVRQSSVQVNRLLDVKLYTFIGNVGGEQ